MLDRPETDAAPVREDRRRARRRPDGDDAVAFDATAAFAVARRRKWWLLAPVLLCPLLAFIGLAQITPSYTASGSLLYDLAQYKVRELQSILQTDPITDAVMASQAEVLRGMAVVEQVVSRLNLQANPEFNPTLRPPSRIRRLLSQALPALFKDASPQRGDAMGPGLDSARNATLSSVQAALTVAPVKASHVLEVSFTAGDPVIGAAAVNDAMDVYVKAQLSAKAGAAIKAREWLEQRARELREAVRRQEDDIARYRAQRGLVEGMHARLDSEQISLLTDDLTRARGDFAAAAGRLDAARGKAGASAQAAIAPSVVQLRARHDQLSAELQSMLGRLGTNHPDVHALHAQLADVDRTVAAEAARVEAAIEADVRAAETRVATLQHNLGDAQAEIAKDATAQVPLNAMQREAEAKRGELQAVLDRLQQTAQQPEIEAPDAHEISLALIPGRPSFPRTSQWIGAATALGLVLGLLLVYVRELADSTLSSSDNVRTVLDLPCLALIPRISRRTLRGATVADYAARNPVSTIAEQLRALRAGLSLAPEHPRTVAIAAARPGEGKTTVTHALGRLAAMNGERVIVVDCDIQRPAGASANQAAAPGLVDCLRERASLAEAIQRNAATGMDFIPCGTFEPNALGLLMSATMVRLLQTLRHDYDLVLLDTPPAEAITDARIVAGLADATLFCVRWRATSHRTALHALDRLADAHANVVGAALTLVDINVHLRSGHADAEAYHPRYGSIHRE
jgi:capsular exopolysaccharide synthesis family protein